MPPALPAPTITEPVRNDPALIGRPFGNAKCLAGAAGQKKLICINTRTKGTDFAQ